MSVQELADSAREMVTTSAWADSVSLEPGARLCGAVFCSVSLDSRFLVSRWELSDAPREKKATSTECGRGSFELEAPTGWCRLLFCAPEADSVASVAREELDAAPLDGIGARVSSELLRFCPALGFSV